MRRGISSLTDLGEARGCSIKPLSLVTQLLRKGFTKEVEEICLKLGLPNGCKEFIRREEVVKNVRLSSLKKLKLDMEGLSKLENMKREDLRKPQDYMHLISLEDARLRV